MGKNMTSPAKNKGNSFEREVAKFLTTIFNEHFNRNIFLYYSTEPVVFVNLLLFFMKFIFGQCRHIFPSCL